MNTDLLQRTTLVLDRLTASRLDTIATRFGISRSQLVREVLLEPVELMHRWVTALPETPTREDAVARMGQVGADLESWLDSKSAQLDLLNGPTDGNA